MNIHTDLAGEIISALNEGKHYTVNKEKYNRINIENYTLLHEHESNNFAMGDYIEIRFKNENDYEDISKVLQIKLEELIKKYDYPTILCVGLGNRFLSSDSLGVKTVDLIKANHYLDDSDIIANHQYDIMTINPGVMFQTGIETKDIVEAIVKQKEVDLVIIIDALCANDYQKLGKVIQINNVGINPGRGINNYRTSINSKTIGCDVIAIGVPTVIYSSSIVRDIFEIMQEYFGDSLNDYNKLKVGKRESYQGDLSLEQKEMLLGHIGLLDNQEMISLLEEVLNPIDKNYILCDKRIDEINNDLSKIIANSINNLKY